MAHKIIEAHDGEMTVTSHPAQAGRNGETTFCVWLPAAGSGPADAKGGQ
jgi:two-component system sensor histidine kinase HydH